MSRDLNTETLGFIGGGNMASAIIGGLINQGLSADRIHVADPSSDQRERLESLHGIHVHDDNAQCVRACSVLVLAVKPQMMQIALSDLADAIKETQPLLISVAAGILIADIQRWARSDQPVIRVMPNTPALVNAGVSGIYCGNGIKSDELSLAASIMQTVGPVVWLDNESDVDVVTGISGSGPAYFFKLMEIMLSAAKKRGLDHESATTLVLNTALGAAQLALSSEDEPGELRRKVTSPNGTTAAALETMDTLGIENTVESGIEAAIRRSAALAAELGEN